MRNVSCMLSDLVVRAIRLQMKDVVSIPPDAKFHHLHWSGQPEEKSVFSCPNKTCHKKTHAHWCHNVPRPMNNVGGLPSSATHPPTPKSGHPPPGGATCTFPKIGGKPDKPTHPPTLRPTHTVPPPPVQYQPVITLWPGWGAVAHGTSSGMSARGGRLGQDTGAGGGGDAKPVRQ